MSTTVSDQCMIEENPQDHPAVTAWQELDPAHRRPERIFALYDVKRAGKKHKSKKKSAVYRLVGASSNGSDIVAKRCSSTTVNLERIVYEDILPQLQIISLECYGGVKIGGTDWLFLEYAQGMQWRLDNETHIELAIQWLVRMRYSSENLDSLSQLPDRGPEYYRSQLEKARQRIQDCYSNQVLASLERDTLDRFMKQIDLLDKHWTQLENLCRSQPVSLVHNDFTSKNLHVRSAKSGPVLLPFDWEMSGKGIPATDLSWLLVKAPRGAIAQYCEASKRFDPSVRVRDIERMAAMGTVFRVTDASEWASHFFLWGYPHKKISHFAKYSDRLSTASAVLGWS